MGTICTPDEPRDDCSARPSKNRAQTPHPKKMTVPPEDSFLQESQSRIMFDQEAIDEAAGGISSFDCDEDDQYNNGPVTVNSDQEASAAKAKKSGFQIVVTPAENEDDEQAGDQASAKGDAAKPMEDDSDSDPMDMKGKRAMAAAPVDSTMGGVISWKKVADFSALLPKDVKLKLWNGVFKTQNDETAAEMKRISRVLRTFVMLHLTRVGYTSCLCANLRSRIPISDWVCCAGVQEAQQDCVAGLEAAADGGGEGAVQVHPGVPQERRAAGGADAAGHVR